MQAALIVLAILAGDPRTWTDQSGKFTVQATMVQIKEGNVHLRKDDGSTAVVPIVRLCDADQRFIKAEISRRQKPIVARESSGTPTEGSVELPRRDAMSPATIRMPKPIRSIKILTPPGSTFVFSIEAIEDQLWAITNGDHFVLEARAEPEMNGGSKLLLSWMANAPDEVECLRNCVLTIETESQPLAFALRVPAEVEAPFVDLDESSFTIPINVPLWGLEPTDLKVEAVGVTTTPVIARIPGHGRADHGRSARLLLRNDMPKAAIELAIAGLNPPELRIKPIFEGFDQKLYPWTSKRVATTESQIVKGSRTCARDIPRLRGKIPVLENNLAVLRRQYRPNSADAPLVELSISNGTRDLNATKTRLKQLENAVPVLEKQGKALAKLIELHRQVHQQDRVQFRVFFIAEGREVTVLQSKT